MSEDLIRRDLAVALRALRNVIVDEIEDRGGDATGTAIEKRMSLRLEDARKEVLKESLYFTAPDPSWPGAG